jgi:hypothetical protein
VNIKKIKSNILVACCMNLKFADTTNVEALGTVALL